MLKPLRATETPERAAFAQGLQIFTPAYSSRGGEQIK
jgi:hypothetical protein